MTKQLSRRRGTLSPHSLLFQILAFSSSFLIWTVDAQGDPTLCTDGLQPVVTGASPPSGTGETIYTVSGENLDQVSTLSVVQGEENLGAVIDATSRSPDEITFSLDSVDGNGAATVILVPMQDGCVNATVELFLLRRGVFFSLNSQNSQSDDIVAVPGTVLTTDNNACLPPDCGDNSTDYDVSVLGRQFQKFSADEISFAIRVPDTDISILSAELFIQTFYSNLSTDTSVNYRVPFPINATTPSSGQRGTRVLIQGENLFGVGEGVITLQQVLVGSSLADIDIDASNSTHVYARVRSGDPGSSSIVVNTTQTIGTDDYDGPYTYSDSLWTQIEDGVINELLPPAVQGGESVIVCGERLLGGGSDIESITIAGQSAVTHSSVQSGTSECIDVVVPAILNPETGVSGEVTIEADTGAIVESSPNTVFTYATVTSVSPSQGQVGTEVTISGIELLSGYSDLQPLVYLSDVLATVISFTADSILVRAEDPTGSFMSGSGQSPLNIINVPGSVAIVVTRDSRVFNVSAADRWTYLESGEIAQVEPDFGQYGTKITLRGTNLLGYSSGLREALINGTAAMIVSQSNTEVVLEAPDISTLGHVDIVLSSDNGAAVSLDQAFEYRAKGVIDTLDPTTGQNGTFVVITGSNLFGHADNITEVRFGDIAADIDYTASTNTRIRVRIQSSGVTSDTSVAVVITATTSAIVESSGNDWTYLVPGRITSVDPDIGQVGTMVTITGTNLLGGGSSVQSILLDGVPAAVNEATATFIRVNMSDISEQIEFYRNEVYIEADTGAIITGGSYQHQTSGVITDFNPRFGREGTRIAITGNNLSGYGDEIDRVLIAGVEGMIVDQDDAGMVVVQAGAALGGTEGPISLISITGAIVSSADGLVFTYETQGNISTVDPPEGAEGSGVLIQGTALKPSGTVIISVTIGGSPVSRIVTESETEVSVIVGPAPETGFTNAPITVTASDGSIVTGGSFTYLDLAVSLPMLDQGQQGTLVQITLPNDEAFDPSLALVATIGGRPAEKLGVSVAEGYINVSTPRAAQVGSFSTDVAVEAMDGRVARLRNGFTYISEGVIFSATPTSGQQGTRVNLVGENLLGGGALIASVRIGEREGTEVSATLTSPSSDSAVELRIMENPPAGTSFPLLGDITLVANTGATIIRVGGFTLIQPGEISSVTPAQGQFGTIVTISGSNLLQGGTRADIFSITLSKVEVFEILDTPSPPSDTQITVRANTGVEGSPGEVNITLITGAEIITPEDVTFQYLPPGTINALTPSIGTVGTIVTITGTNLLGGGSVQEITLGGTTAQISDTPTDTQIRVRAQQPAAGSGGSSNGPVEITIDTGAVVSGGSWVFEELGDITQISPTLGQQGITVTATGTSLLGSSAATFSTCSLAGTPGLVTQSTDTAATCEVGFNPSAGINTDTSSLSGPLQLTADSGPVLTSAEEFSYYVAFIETIEPENGTNGTYITISGRNLIGSVEGEYDVASVTFGGLSTLGRATVLSLDSIRVRIGPSMASVNNTVRLQSTSNAFLELESAWEYNEPGEILSVSPQTGLPGETVIINGSNIVPPCVSEATVIVGQTRSYTATVVNSSLVEFRLGPYQSEAGTSENLEMIGGMAPIQVIASNGATVYSTNIQFQYVLSSARVDSISPRAGSEGTVVTIAGENLLSGGNSSVMVTLAGRNATIMNSSDTEVIVVAGEGPDEGGTGRVIIESDNGLVSGIGTDAWEYIPVITAALVSPQTGQNGTNVSIDLRGFAPTVTAVYLTEVAAEPLDFVGGAILIRANPSPETPLGDIRVEFVNGITLTIQNAWSYQPPITITEITPPQGYFNSLVTIRGSNFQAGGSTMVASVELAGFQTEIVSQSNTELQVRVREFRNSSAGPIVGPVAIYSQDGATYFSEDQGILFTYVQLRVDDVSPASGQGGTVVTISGVGLLAGASPDQPLQEEDIQLAGVNVERVLSTTDTEIRVGASPLLLQTNVSDITYTTANGGSVVIPSLWTYLQPGVVTSITPSQGAQGSYVTIRGVDMLQGGAAVSSVMLGDIPAMEIVVGFNDFIQVRAGESSISAPRSVSIEADTGALLSSTVTFEYISSGSIASVLPAQGQNGTRVTLTGTGFTSFGTVSTVSLAGVEAVVTGLVSDISITVEAGRPSIFEGFSGPVIIETDSGTVITGGNDFVYIPEGVIYTAEPQQGQVGTQVRITGEGLFGGGARLEAVYLAGVEAVVDESESSNSAVTVTASEVDSAPLTGDILLLSDTGAFVRKIDAWSYVEPGSIANIDPGVGQFGTQISIGGTRLLSGGSSVSDVLIGNISAYVVLSSTDTTVSARVGRPGQVEGFTDDVTLVSDTGGRLVSTFLWTYLNSSEVFSVSPQSGTGGDIVIVEGRNLLGGGTRIVSVSTAGVDAINITESTNNSRIVFTAGFHPTGMEIQGDIVIESDTGALTIIEGGWSYDNACPEGQFGTVGSCMPCDDECTVCTGPSNEDCLECENFVIPLSNSGMRCVERCPNVSTLANVCVDACESNQYSRIDTTVNARFCYDCHSLCNGQLGCRGPDATECTQCEIVLDVFSMTCASSCRMQTWQNELNQCIPCDVQCVAAEGCFGDTNADCNVCRNVRVAASLVPENGPDGSAAGSGIRANDICLERCPMDFYEDGDRDCQPCDEECRGGCTGPTPFDCNNCANVFLEQADTRHCVSTCNADLSMKTLYDDSDGACQTCSSLCSLTGGCTGESSTDCNGCRINTTANISLPLFQGACVLSCPNTTASASPRPSSFYYHNMLTGSCELCHSSCTNGCTSSGAEDCTPEEDETTSLFAAGPGTIGVFIVVAIILAIVCVLLILFLIWCGVKGSSRKRYVLDGDATDNSNVEMGNRYAARPVETQMTSPPKKETKAAKGSVNEGFEEGLAFYTAMAPTSPVAPELKERSQSPQHGPIVYVAEKQYDDVCRTVIADAGLTMIANEDIEGDVYSEAGPESPDVSTVPQIPVKEKPKPKKEQKKEQKKKQKDDKEKKSTIDRRGKPPPPVIAPYNKKPERPPAALPPPSSSQPKKPAKKPAPQPPPEPEVYTDMTASVQEVYVQPDTGPDQEYSEMAHLPQGGTEEFYDDASSAMRPEDLRSPQKPPDDKAPLIEDLYEDTETTMGSSAYQSVKHSVSAATIPTGAPQLPKQPVPRKRSVPLPVTPLEASIHGRQPQPIAEDVYDSAEPLIVPEESLYEAIPTTVNRPLPSEPSPEIVPKKKGKKGGNYAPVPPRGKK